MMFSFDLPTRIIFGSGSLAQLGVEAGKLGRKAILVTGRSSMRKTGVLDRVVQDLRANGVDTLVYDKVESNPRTSTIDEGAKITREKGIDLVIGLGGGSAMDAAKGIVLASTDTKPIWDYVVGSGGKVRGPAVPLILVPTVAATGSEANNIAVITNWEIHEKRALARPFPRYLFAQVSIVDPDLTLTLPKKPTAQGGVDIFCHLVEPYLTTESPSPLTDGILETVMKLVVEFLPKALTRLDDIEARTQLSWTSTIAMSQFATLGGGAGIPALHGIEHPLSGYYDIAHGEGLAALLPAWMRFILPVKKERLYSLGKNVFGEADGIVATERWLERVGMRLQLRNLGIELERIEEIADCAERTFAHFKSHPSSLNAAAAVKIYQASY